MNRSITAAALSAVLSLTMAWAQSKSAKVILLVGPPGSGKSTQAQFLAKKYGIRAVSMGDILKKEISSVQKKDPVSKAMAAAVASGDLLPDEPAAEMVRHYLLRSDVHQGMILDGFPATGGQAKALEKILQEKGLPRPVVVVLEAPDEVIRKRMLTRGRADDKAEIVERRIRDYRSEATALTDWAGTTMTIRVNGAAPVGDVSKQIVTGLEDFWSKQAQQ